MSSVRNHPLEGGGCRVTFNQYLTRSSEVASVVKIRIPTTVVFEHNCPRAWYEFDEEIGEVRRLVGKDLQSGSIYQGFTSDEPNKTPEEEAAMGMGTRKKGARYQNRRGKVDVIATFTSVQEDSSRSDSEPSVTVLYFNAQELLVFLSAPHPAKRQGILQRYIPPLETNETILQATWSPRVCIIRRRTSCHTLTDLRHSIADRYITFDGPEHHSVEGACAKDTVRVYGALCEDIADHLHRTQHLKVASMIMFFKQNSGGEPTLLWCAGLQFQGFRAVKPFQQTNFTSPEQEESADTMTKRLLKQVDPHHSTLSHSFGSPRRKRGNKGDGDDTLNSTKGGTLKSREKQTPAFIRKQRAAQLESGVQELCESWYKVSDEIEEEYYQIKDHAEAAQGLLEDTLYMAMSRHSELMARANELKELQFKKKQIERQQPNQMGLRPTTNTAALEVVDIPPGGGGASKASSPPSASAAGPTNQFAAALDEFDIRIRLPTELNRYFSAADATAQLIKIMGVEELPSGDISLTSAPQRKTNPPPIPTMMTQAREWVSNYFERQLDALRSRATSQIQVAAVRQALAAIQKGNSNTQLSGGTGRAAPTTPAAAPKKKKKESTVSNLTGVGRADTVEEE